MASAGYGSTLRRPMLRRPRDDTPARRRARVDALVLAAAAFGLALLQRPGWASSDTKIDLHVDPVPFLGDVAAVWSPTGDLGHVHGGQYAGYLFPMGPFFALGDLAGLAPWLIHRLWLGAVLAIAVVGAVRLADALLPDGDRPARLVAGAVVLLNPYVVVFANRTSITLLAYALLPWLLLVVHRGLRAPRSWWWPAALALIVGGAGGGVNAAVIAWLLLAPALLLVYEPLLGTVAPRAAVAFATRAVVCLAIASLWWAMPVIVHALYGRNFLVFTEQPGVIWSTTSASEVLRLMGYWTSYVGVGYAGDLRAYTSDAGAMLFNPVVVTGSLLLPALVAASLLAARRWAYAPYFLGLLILAALIAMAGFPDGTPLRRATLAAYFRIEPIQFLRTTYKAAPLLVVAFAMLTAAAAPVIWRRPGRARFAAAAALAAALALSAYPLVRGQAIDSQLSWREIPPAWIDAARDLDADLRPNTRAAVLPGQLFATYRWGTTVDPLLPALTDRPVAVRTSVPYADLRAVDMLWTVDNLLQQERLLPGQLPPLLRLLGVGAVITGADDERSRSGAINAAGAALQLGPPDRTYGRPRIVRPEAGTLEPPLRVPRVARREVPSGPGIVRVQPTGPATLVDGSAETLSGLAALGALDAERPLAYAADRTTAELREAAGTGAEIVIGDGNRRRVTVAPRTRQDAGPVTGAADEIPPDASVLDPVAAGSAAQTVAVYDGIRALRSDPLPGVSQFPEHRPFAALDGTLATSWVAPDHADITRHWIEVELLEAQDVPHVDLLPLNDGVGRTTAVAIAGRRFELRPGWNRLRLGLRGVRSLRVTVADTEKAPGVDRAPGGIAELRIPGVRVREWLRPPRVLEDALRGADLARSSLSYVFQRTTGATPFRRGLPAGDPQARLVRDRGDAESQIARRIAPPAARAYAAAGWVTVSPAAHDAALDALAGTVGGRFESSGRYEGRPGRRASRAFDGDPTTAWIAPWGERRAWLEWAAPRPVTLRSLLLRPVAGVRRARTVVLRPRGARPTPPLPVGPGGRVDLPRPVRASAFRLDIVAASFEPGTPGVVRQRRAVGIADVAGAGARAVDGRTRLDRRTSPETAAGGDGRSIAVRRIAAACGALRVEAGGRVLALRPVGSVADLDAGRPLRARSCGAPVALPAREIGVVTSSQVFRPYWLRLRSPAPEGLPAPAGGGRVVDPGEHGRVTIDGVRLDLDGPSWLVLAQGYDRGWRAWCDGRALGAPRPAAAFGNGWIVPADCRQARFAYAPDAVVRAALIGSGGASLIALLVLTLRRPPPPRRTAAPGFDPARADRPPREPWPLALAIGAAAGLAAAFLIALRAAPPVAIAVALVARHGIGARPLILAAIGLLGVAIPAVYLLFEPDDLGGYNFSYAGDLIAAHWLGVAALVLLALALWRTVSTARAPSDARAHARRPAAAPPTQP
jgi:arabinofuranan 3-O-arabinosyltransferase